MISVENEDILKQTELVEKEYLASKSAPIIFSNFMQRVSNNLYKNIDGYPKEIRLPKSLDRLLKGDTSPERIIKLDSPIMHPDGYPVWQENSSKGIRLLGAGYKNGDSRYPCEVNLDDSNVHAFLIGVTGQGKSVTLNSIINSVTTLYAPWEVKLTLADAKIVEFKKYAFDGGLPHISSIAATTDTDYIISVLETLANEMSLVNSMFTANGVSNIQSFREKTGLAFPRNIIVVDELQVMFLQAGKKSKTLDELFTLYARLGRNTGYHLLMASQDSSGVPSDVMSNTKLRMALGCMANISNAILGNDEAKINMNEKGRLIINNNPSLASKKDNLHFRVPYLSDSEFSKHRSIISEIGENAGFSYYLSFYDEDSYSEEEEYYNKVSENLKGRNDRIYLGEPSFVMKGDDGSGLTRINLTGDDIENILVYTSTKRGIERYTKMLKYNIKAMGNSVKSSVYYTDRSLVESLGMSEIDPVSMTQVRESSNEILNSDIFAIYLKKLCLESDHLTFSSPNRNSKVDQIFDLAIEGFSEYNTELNKNRAYSILSLMSSPLYEQILGLSSLNEEQLYEKRKEILLTSFHYFNALNSMDKKLEKEDLTPVFYWFIGIDKVMGWGVDPNSRELAKFKKVLQDAYTVNVRFICTGLHLEEFSSLKSCWRFVVMEGLDENKAKRAGCEDYPTVVSKVSGVLYDKNSENLEAIKFKKMAFTGEILT